MNVEHLVSAINRIEDPPVADRSGKNGVGSSFLMQPPRLESLSGWREFADSTSKRRVN
jgi:hypothetical protein